MDGKIYEQQAMDYLNKNQFRIITHNYRTIKGEIDIIAEKDNDLHFIEVKGRENSYFGSPEEYVTKKKQQNIKASAKEYMSHNKKSYRYITFDVIAIDYSNKLSTLTFFENAF